MTGYIVLDEDYMTFCETERQLFSYLTAQYGSRIDDAPEVRGARLDVGEMVDLGKLVNGMNE